MSCQEQGIVRELMEQTSSFLDEARVSRSGTPHASASLVDGVASFTSIPCNSNSSSQALRIRMQRRKSHLALSRPLRVRVSMLDEDKSRRFYLLQEEGPDPSLCWNTKVGNNATSILFQTVSFILRMWSSYSTPCSVQDVVSVPVVKYAGSLLLKTFACD